MRVDLAFGQMLLGNALSVSAALIPAQGAVSESAISENLHLVKRSNTPHNQHMNLPAPSPSIIADLPALPKTYSAPLLNLTSLLRSAQIHKFRVPRSTIELHLTTTKYIDGQNLGNTLLSIHEYLNDHIEAKGDGPLAPADDPFLWKPDGPPRGHRARRIVSRAGGGSIVLTAQSVPGEQMTWSVLSIAVEGLYLYLSALGREVGARFAIWDWREEAQWGFGEVDSVA